ncbi:TPA: hypothetical protein ACH3X1_014597 [Trebouxia sp. C0004]
MDLVRIPSAMATALPQPVTATPQAVEAAPVGKSALIRASVPPGAAADTGITCLNLVCPICMCRAMDRATYTQALEAKYDFLDRALTQTDVTSPKEPKGPWPL